MAIIKCMYCSHEQGYTVPGYPTFPQRDVLGRVIKEGPWVFDPVTGACISDLSGNRFYGLRCFNCWTGNGHIYSSELPPRPVPTAEEVEEWVQVSTHYGVWRTRNRKPCSCKGSFCQGGSGGIGGCGCHTNGFACSILCGCGGRDQEAQCLNPYTPPPNAIPSNAQKKCSCYTGCTPDLCGCAGLAVGCSSQCVCKGNCLNGRRS
ncbi:hypothetical protein GYMLUDRAFT_100035 [Collybiopsis luxurians FD-317 M1]|uniref:Uncharacterized protein n=1 Tax=Collybiopsis luxurians FD-317 M1 TaxID=944289 RepID=A0A0D0BIF1_9AGAR|nr:hypothetical protein GYMLUDRAFT_100035 [Collybiopsis luxurians FD-317 M1]